jgi:hypothetical protein
MTLGPVHLLVIGTPAQPDGSVLAELDRLAEEGIVRLVDLVVVERTDEGFLDTLPAPPGLHTGLGRIAEEFLAGPAGFATDAGGPEGAKSPAGAAVAEPAGAGGDAPVKATAGASVAGPGGSPAGTPATWSLLDAVPIGQTAVVALIEHVWARPLQAALRSAGAEAFAESWLGPADLADLEAIVDKHAGPAAG